MDNQSKTCFLFSGQGSQYSGMGKELTEAYTEARAVYECGSDILGFNLKEICFNADNITLSQTSYSQPAIFATSLAAFEAVKKQGVNFGAVAGHSLGEYAAMVASKMLTMEQGFEVIKKRAHAMEECSHGQNGAMCAVMWDSSSIEQVCADISGYVVPVNYNSPSQTVIAGDADAVTAAAAKFAELGKRAIKLNVSAAFHSKLMQSGADMFFDSIENVHFLEPQCAFYSNVLGNRLTDFSDMRAYLKSHLVSPVLFCQELFAIKADGFSQFVECGPGKVLTGLVKKTLDDVSAFNVENAKTLQKLCEANGI